MRSTANAKAATFLWEAYLLQGLIALIGGVGLFLVSLLVGSLLIALLYTGRIYPKVQVAGVDLSGMTVEQAAQTLEQMVLYPQTGRIVLRDRGRIWSFHPVELGFSLNAQQSAVAAYRFGREGPVLSRIFAPLKIWLSGVQLSPRMTYDERQAQGVLQKIAEEIEVPVTEASLSIRNLEVEAVPGSVGRSLDFEGTLLALRDQLSTLTDGIVEVRVKEQAPAILDLSAQAETLQRILSAPLVLKLSPSAEEGSQWLYEPQELARMVAIERVQGAASAFVRIGLQEERLRAELEEIAAEINRPPENARFIFNDETRQLEVIQPAVIGRTLNIEQSIRVVEQRLLQGEHEIELVVDTQPPTIGDSVTAEELGIRELVASYTSYFYGSSAERIQNIQTAAARFHGVLVAPGEIFSMVDKLGDVSLDNGYTEALIIFGGRTIKGVGGGVCQVSTTLFRTAFFGGYPIVERHPHAYRVSYYEQTRSGALDPNLAGLDATVFAPVVDFKFKNDTPYWLLMETYVNAPARTL
ncbi:MAG: VanW family protein, partial [Anaerolineales bacterium]|nr:VanW family protein [Anaerolineales bacterium]MDW8445835.1 VanW family protein [Anaerolineales bacterium]